MRVLLLLLCIVAGTACGGAKVSRTPLPAEAQAWLDRAAEAESAGDFLLALVLADSAEARAQGHPTPLIFQAGVQLAMGRYAAADSLYALGLEADPSYPGAWLNRGNVAFTQRRFRTASNYYQREVRDEARVWHARGAALEQVGALDSASAAFQTAVDRDPLFAPARKSLAEFMERGGDIDGALREARAAFQMDSTASGLRLLLARLEARHGDAEQGVRLLEGITRAEPWNYTARFALGQALQRLGDGRAADVLEAADSVRAAAQPIERMEMNARDFPSVENLVRYAEGLRLAGRLSDALETYQQAVALDPGDFRLASNLATLYLQSGQTEEALARYQGIIRTFPQAPEPWINLALHFGRAGDLRQASRYLAGAEVRAPDHPAVVQMRALIPRGG
ncbi:MAG: tetratricopeptide repeat protein [Rhodothermales bacterium]|nr:tetratricopeptide repeat protein [Rhodothermales bacterium]MBO6780020.1 tetratricopeptide repeat protein [Rhodothermales bacterium]